MLQKSFIEGNEDHKLVQIAASNFILNFANSLLKNTLLMNQRRSILSKILYEVLCSDTITHRYKNTMALALSKLMIGTWCNFFII